MPNSIKYSISAQTLALKKGNFWIGTGDVGKGPTSTTDYWNGISPSGGYTIYLNKGSNGPAIFSAANDAALISISNRIAGQTFETAAAALAWFATQTDKMVFNEDYPAIVTDGLVLNLDAGFTPSYPTTGTTWYDVSSGGNNGALTNGNKLEAQTEVGWSTIDTDNPCLNIIGSYINKTQYLDDSGIVNITLNGGNNIIISGTATTIFLPANPSDISILYNCFKTIDDTITIRGNGHTINGASIFLFTGLKYSLCTILYDTVGTPQWLLNLNAV